MSMLPVSQGNFLCCFTRILWRKKKLGGGMSRSDYTISNENKYEWICISHGKCHLHVFVLPLPPLSILSFSLNWLNQAMIIAYLLSQTEVKETWRKLYTSCINYNCNRCTPTIMQLFGQK